MLWKKLLEAKESPISLFPILSRWKPEFFVNFIKVKNRVFAFIPESKTTFQNYIHYDGPCLSTINLTDLEVENAFASLKTNKSSGYDDTSADFLKICPMKNLLFWNILSISP